MGTIFYSFLRGFGWTLGRLTAYAFTHISGFLIMCLVLWLISVFCKRR